MDDPTDLGTTELYWSKTPKKNIYMYIEYYLKMCIIYSKDLFQNMGISGLKKFNLIKKIKLG